MTSLTLENQTSATVSLEDKGLSPTWDNADLTWDEAIESWDDVGTLYKRESKTSATVTYEPK